MGEQKPLQTTLLPHKNGQKPSKIVTIANKITTSKE